MCGICVGPDFVNNCKFGNFCENVIFANSVIRHICHVKNSRLGHDLPTSVNDRVRHLARRNFASNFAKIKPSRKFLNFSVVLCVKQRGCKLRQETLYLLSY